MRQSIIRKRAKAKLKAEVVEANNTKKNTLIAKLHRQNRGLRNQSEAGYCAELPDKLAGLKGGAKHMLLRQCREEVLEYMAVKGERATMLRYRITDRATLDNLVQRGGESEPPVTFLDVMYVKELAEKVLLQDEITKARQSEINKRMAKLEADFAQFTQAVTQNLGNKYEQVIALGLQQIIQLPSSLEVGDKPDPLGFASLFETIEGTKQDTKALPIATNPQTSESEWHQKIRDIMEGTLNPKGKAK